MRIGEFGRQLNDYLNDGQIIIHAQQLNDGYGRYQLMAVKNLRRTLNFINDQEWLSEYVNPDLIGILSNYSVNDDTIVLTGSDYSKVIKAIKELNTKLAITTGILKDFSPDQDEQIINIKLPRQIHNLEDLQDFNARLNKVFKKFNITGDFELKGFDRGTEWYQILIDAPALYKYFVATLGLALSIVALRKQIFESEIARINLRMLKQKEKDISEEQWKEELTAMKAEEEVPKIVDQLGTTDNKTPGEMNAMVIKATTELVKELEQGTEFHLSLTPPKYLNEKNEGGTLTIDYSSIPPIEQSPQLPKELGEGGKGVAPAEQ